MGFGSGLSGLAFVPEGYNQAMDDEVKRRQQLAQAQALQNQIAGQNLLGQIVQSYGQPGAPQPAGVPGASPVQAPIQAQPLPPPAGAQAAPGPGVASPSPTGPGAGAAVPNYAGTSASYNPNAGGMTGSGERIVGGGGIGPPPSAATPPPSAGSGSIPTNVRPTTSINPATGAATPTGQGQNNIPGAQMVQQTYQQLFADIARRAPPGTPPAAMAQAAQDALPFFQAQNQQIMAQERAAMQLQLEQMREQNRILLEQLREGAAGTRQDKSIAAAGERQDKGIAAAGERAAQAQQAASDRITQRGEQKAGEQAQAGSAVIGQVQEAIDDINKSLEPGAPFSSKVVGLPGLANRYVEWAKNTLGMDDKTAAAQFRAKIEAIQTEVPRIMSGSKYMSAADRAKVDEWIAGLGKATSPQQARDILMNLQRFLASKTGASVPGQPGAAIPGRTSGTPQQQGLSPGSTVIGPKGKTKPHASQTPAEAPPVNMLPPDGSPVVFQGRGSWRLDTSTGQPVQILGGQ